MNLLRYKMAINKVETIKYVGEVEEAYGLMIKSRGPQVVVGEVCSIITSEGARVQSEVIGVSGSKVLLMPYDDVEGIEVGNIVVGSGQTLKLNISEDMLGRVFDGIGRPLDGREEIYSKREYSINNKSPNPLERKRIKKAISTGIKGIDGFLTVGEGQRMGIFAGTGVGKSTLLGMIARHSDAQVNVIALVGERGREVREFIENDLGEEGLKRSVVIVASSDTVPLMRVRAAFVATRIAEYFRDTGKRVILMMDSITRFARAQREVGLFSGEPPTMRAYPPSVYTLIPKLIERTGASKDNAITSFYTVLVEGDDFNEPITDNVRGVLDGHIILSRGYAMRGQYPAISIDESISRLAIELISEKSLKYVMKLREVVSVYKSNEDFIKIGAYVKGSDSKIDYAIEMIEKINEILKQGIAERTMIEDTFKAIYELFGDSSFDARKDIMLDSEQDEL